MSLGSPFVNGSPTGLKRREARGAVQSPQQFGLPSGARGVVGEQAGGLQGRRADPAPRLIITELENGRYVEQTTALSGEVTRLDTPFPFAIDPAGLVRNTARR